MVTLMPKLPFSENIFATDVSNTKQSEFAIALNRKIEPIVYYVTYLATPSWIDRGVASHVNRRLCPFEVNSSR